MLVLLLRICEPITLWIIANGVIEFTYLFIYFCNLKLLFGKQKQNICKTSHFSLSHAHTRGALLLNNLGTLTQRKMVMPAVISIIVSVLPFSYRTLTSMTVYKPWGRERFLKHCLTSSALAHLLLLQAMRTWPELLMKHENETNILEIKFIWNRNYYNIWAVRVLKIQSCNQMDHSVSIFHSLLLSSISRGHFFSNAFSVENCNKEVTSAATPVALYHWRNKLPCFRMPRSILKSFSFWKRSVFFLRPQDVLVSRNLLCKTA